MSVPRTCLDNDFLGKSKKIEVLGEGTFGSVSLYETPLGNYVIKETKIKNKSPGYPPDLLMETDMLVKFRLLPNIVRIEGIFFDTKDKKGYIILEPLDCNLTKWAEKTPFNVRIKMLPKLITNIGKVLAVLKYFSFVHNDIKTNNILVKQIGPDDYDFKLADFGKALYVVDKNIEYGGIYKYQTLYNKDIFSSEYWAFMVVLVEVILGGKKMVNAKSLKLFYSRYMKNKTYDLEKYLKFMLSKEEYNLIPKIFWDFVNPTLHFINPADILMTIKSLGVDLSIIEDIDNNISKSVPMHSGIKKAVDHIIKRLTDLNLTRYIERVVNVFNKFVHINGNKLYNVDLLHYSEVAIVTATFGKVKSYRYFQEQEDFLLFQRFFLTTLNYQVIII